MTTRDVDMTPAAVGARLRAVCAASNLSREGRLDAKLDLSPRGVTQRLREAAALLALARRLRQR
ncbi:MAG TPA: hypothetical protein VJT73_20840 [Polyangiaceae bacterium]|nr:hypothetical protein [Polyangiaceae bacterium]